jgi:hypothetical protein
MGTPIDLMLDNDNELRFKVNIEGTRPGSSVCRLMLESSDIQYGFKGIQTQDGEISVVIPPLKSFLKEGIYDTHLEVVVDDRIFIPLEMQINFEKSVSVTAESVVRPRRTRVGASAVLLEAPGTNNKTESKTTLNDIKKSRNKRKASQEKSVDGRQILELLQQIKKQKGK